jgi:hypothetical protein
MDPFDKHRASPAVLAERERQLGDLAMAVVDIEALTDTAFNPAVASWEGIAAAELRAAPRPVRDQAYAVASQLTWAATSIRVWAGQVRAFNATVDALRDERAALPVEVERQLARWASLPVLDQEVLRERKRDQLLQDLYRRWREAYQQHIEDGSREVAGMLERGPTWENLLLARRRGGLAGGSPLCGFFGAAWAATAAPVEALRLAGRLVDPARAPASGDLARLHRLLSRYAGDRAFWHRFLTDLGPERLLLLSGRVALHLPAGVPLAGSGGGHQDRVGSLQSLLGAGLALATARRGAPVAPGGGYTPADHELPPRWLRALVAAGRQRYDIGTSRSGSWLPLRLYGYQLLGPLLRTGGYDRRFLRDVGGDLIDFEQERGGPAVWTGWLAGAGSVRLDWTGPAGGQPAGFDPVPDLLSALERHPEGALDLLAGRVETGAGQWSDGSPKGTPPPPGGHRLPRLDYLLTDRQWPPGWPSHHPGLGPTGPDTGQPDSGPARVGAVLERVARLADPRAVEVVELIVYELNTDEQAMGYPDRAVPGRGGTATAPAAATDLVHPAIRASLARIVGDYIIDVNAAVRDSGSALPGGRGATFDPTHVVRLLADLGRSRPAHERVLSAQTGYAATAYHFYLSGAADLRPDDLPARLAAAEGVARGYGTVAGALDAGATTADWYAQWRRDLDANARLADELRIAELVVGAGAELVSAEAPGLGYLAGELVGRVLADAQDPLADHSGWSDYRAAVRFGDGRRIAATLAEVALYHSGALEGLADYRLSDPAGRPTPMAEWTEPDRLSWAAYKNERGAATAGALPDRAGAAYAAGVDRARLLLSGPVPAPPAPEPVGAGR